MLRHYGVRIFDRNVLIISGFITPLFEYSLAICSYSSLLLSILQYLRTLYSYLQCRQIFPILTARLKNSEPFRSNSSLLRSKSVVYRYRSRLYRIASSVGQLSRLRSVQVHHESLALWPHRRWCARRTSVIAIVFRPFRTRLTSVSHYPIELRITPTLFYLVVWPRRSRPRTSEHLGPFV